jgi:hypothetical protein
MKTIGIGAEDLSLLGCDTVSQDKGFQTNFKGSDCTQVIGKNFMNDTSSHPRKVEFSVSTSKCRPTANMRPDQKGSGMSAFP